MAGDPYAPPKAVVRDVPAVPNRYWVRTRWFYLCLFGFLSYAMFAALDTLLTSFTVVAVGYAVTIGILISVAPIQTIVARRTSALPWWWNVAFWSIVGVTVVGPVIDAPALMVIGLLSIMLLVGVITVATWIVEVRHNVRAYSTAWAMVFVGKDAL